MKEVYPDSWSIGLIKPIYKKGSKNDPSNYRGITLLPVMGKLFPKTLASRLSYWADVIGKLNEAQFGFRENRRTIDAIFIMHTQLQQYNF